MPVCLLAYVSRLPLQMLHGGVHQFQLLLCAAGQKLDVLRTPNCVSQKEMLK